MNDRIIRLLSTLRAGFEARCSELAMPTLRSFPRGSCDWATLFINSLLLEMGFDPLRKRAFRENGESQRDGHTWTMLEAFNLDITADQFPDGEPIIYTANSPFHSTFTEDVSIDRISMTDYAHISGLVDDYESVRSWLHMHSA